MSLRWAFVTILGFFGRLQAEPGISVQPVRQASGMYLDGRAFDSSRAALSFGEASAAPGPFRAALRFRNSHPAEARSFELVWRVTDIRGKLVHETKPEKHELQPQKDVELECSVPAEGHVGPLVFRYEATAGDKKLNGAIPAAQANTVLLLDDFERLTRPIAGNVRMDSAAAHTGQFGLRTEPSDLDRARLAALAAMSEAAGAGNLEACRKAAKPLADLQWAGRIWAFLQDEKLKDPERVQSLRNEVAELQKRFSEQQAAVVPLGICPPGRPVSVSVWVRPVKPGGSLDLNLHAVLTPQGQPRHRWTLAGPELDWQGWREVIFDLPIYDALNQPADPNELKRNPKAEGPANYPFRLEFLAVRGMAAVSLDDLTLRTQDDATKQLQWIIGGKFPGGFVLPGEPVRVLLLNTSASRPLKGSLACQLADLGGKPHVEEQAAIVLAPGQSQVREVSTKALPIGVYGLRLRIDAGNGVTYRNDLDEKTGGQGPGERIVVYRPDVPRLDVPGLCEHLRDGHAVEMELGKTHEVIKMQWENSYPERRDGIEPREGLWQWHDYDAAVDRTVRAGKSIIGRLGLTAAWASPAGQYDAFHNQDWVGSPFILPERGITWERYVYQVVKRYRKQVGTWEIWNEPDDPAFSTTAKEFTERIVKVAAKAAREAAPGSKLLLGGISRERLLPFLRDFIQAGGHQLVDAIGLHLTVDPLSPERGFLEEQCREACGIAEKAGVAEKLWVTELGWNVGGPDDVTELEQAQYLTRALVLARFAGIRQILVDLHSPQWDEKSAGLLFKTKAEPDFVQYRLGAFAFKQFQRTLTDKAAPVAEVCLRDRTFHVARAYLFRRPEDYVLALWRVQGSARMPRLGDKIQDMLGNQVPASESGLEITPTPLYVFLPQEDVTSPRRRLERLQLRFEDAPDSEWKMNLSTFVDVGDPAEEKTAGYEVSGKSLLVTKTALYPNKRELRDAGRVVHGAETYSIPLRDLGHQDLILRRRVDYSAAAEAKAQKCQVTVDGQAVGVWSVTGKDQERQWRDAFFLVPNRFLAGKTAAKVCLAAVDGPFTTFEFAAGPKKPGPLYLSDIEPLVDSQGWVGLARPDANFLGSGLSVRQKKYNKGLGVHAPSVMVYSLNRQFAKFHFHPGIDDVTEGKGSVRFKVIVDGRPAFDSNRVDAFAPLQSQAVDVANAETLQLVVEDGADGKENDIADWADARLTP